MHTKFQNFLQPSLFDSHDPETFQELDESYFSLPSAEFSSLQLQQITLCLCNEIPKKMKITGLTISLGVAAAFMVVISFACRGRRNTASRRVGGGAGAVLGGGGGRGCGSGVVGWGTGRGGGRVETSTLLSI